MLDNVDLNGLATFVEVARSGGFSAAARRLRIPRSTTSLRVRVLEEALGVRLFRRSTRTVVLTQEGEALYAVAGPALMAMADAATEVRGSDGQLRGNIRLTAPADFPTAILASAVGAFRAKHPLVNFELILTNLTLDLIADNIDVALRIGDRNSPDTVLRALPPLRYALFATPDYSRRAGRPFERVEDIADLVLPHREIREFLERNALGGVTLPQAAIEANNFILVRDLVLAGQGVGLMPELICRRELATGELVPVLPDLGREPVRVSLAFSHRADMVSRVRAFADVLQETLAAGSIMGAG